MTGRTIVLDVLAAGQGAAALLVDGRLEDLLIDAGDGQPASGTILQARVDRLVPKARAAFVKLDGQGTGYLRDAAGLREGDRVLVQITGQAEEGKALPVSRRVLYKGRWLIHTPGAPGINVSRRIGNEAERERLTGIVAGWRAVDPQLSRMQGQDGFIVRTAARGAAPEPLQAEISLLLAERQAQEIGAPRSKASAAFSHALREWTAENPEAVVIAPRAEEEVRELLTRRGDADSDLTAVLRRHDGPDPFEDLGLLDQIERLADSHVDLPSGGFMTVEPTRALVAVDVNTGDRFSAGAALTANLEAARELSRQLRLRGLGGQVSVDFAPVPKKDRRRVEEALKAAFRRDPVETSVAGWTPLGLCELSRKRERRPLAEVLQRPFSGVFTRA